MIPSMDHLPGFWDDANWNDAAWAEYQKRRREHGRRNRIEQFLHRAMGRILSLDAWKRREAGQWPSSSGSYDPAEDHYNFLLGRAQLKDGGTRKLEAAWFLCACRARRPEFLA